MYLIMLFVFVVGSTIFNLATNETTVQDIIDVLLEMITNPIRTLLVASPIFILIGALCKEVRICKDRYIIVCMFGLIKQEFLKENIKKHYNDSRLITPTAPYTVSNQHIKISDGKKSAIIYTQGTSDFDSLNIYMNSEQR